MSAVRLAWTAAGGSSMGNGASVAGGVDASLSGAGGLIGTSPLNAAILTPPGYTDAATQYALDQLTFAFSQGEYTALGATPQTYVQNLLGSASPVLQLSTINQTIFNLASVQTNPFAMNAQTMGIYGTANSFAGPFAGAGSFVGAGSFAGGSPFGPSIPFASIATSADLPGLSGIGRGLDGSSGILTPGSTDLGVGMGVPTAGTTTSIGGAGAIVNGVPTLVGQVSSGSTQPASEFAPGNAGSVSSSGGTPTTNPIAVAASAGSSGSHDSAVQHQDASPATAANPAASLSGGLTLKISGADPFAHYTSLGQGAPSVQAQAATDHSVSIGHDAGAAAVIGGDSFSFSPHFFNVYEAHMSQAAEIHLDPVGHALQHAADAGGHLI